MKLEAVITYCRSFVGATESEPFGPGDLVFKVGGKMFASVGTTMEPRLSVKCDPDLAEDLRRVYPAITYAPYMSRRHWNRVLLDGSVPEPEIRGMIKHSYELVFSALPRAVRAGLEA